MLQGGVLINTSLNTLLTITTLQIRTFSNQNEEVEHRTDIQESHYYSKLIFRGYI